MHANQDLIAREADLPGLALILDPKRLAEAIGCTSLQLDYLRLKSGTSCVASYRIGDNWLIAKAVTMDRLDELRPGPGLPGLPHRVLHELALEIMPAAADKRMRGLADALDPSRSAAFLAHWRIIGIDADRMVPLKLKPQRRLVGRLDRRGKPVAFLKIHARERFAAALIAATLSQLGGGPRLLHADAKSGVILTEWLEGHTLQAGSSEDDQFFLAGRLLAQVHALDLPMPTQTGRAEDFSSAKAVIDDCAHLLPSLQNRLSALYAIFQDALLAQPTTPGLIHGDFSADQVLISPSSPCLIDWDRSAIGDRGSDIGCFLARLDKDVLDGTADPGEAARARNGFLDGYAGTAPLPPSSDAQHLRHLVLLLIEDFRHQRPCWDKRTEALLVYIESLLPDLPVPLLANADVALSTLADAMHIPRMAPLLEQAGYRLKGTPRLFRHKPGRRAIVHYNAEPQALLGKMGRKGLDRRTIRLQRQLRAAGFDGSSPLHIEVPDVVVTSPELGLWVMPQLAGSMLDPRQHGDWTFFETGMALAHLHSAPVEWDRAWTMQDEADVLVRALSEVEVKRPDLESELQRIVEKARRMIADLPLSRQALLHRDFYQDQVLVPPKGIVLLDLDLVAFGEPAIDVGNFLAHLQELSLRGCFQFDAFASRGDAFLAGYASVRPLPPLEAIEHMREISLWRHLAICQRFTERQGYFNTLMDHALAYLHHD